MAGKTAKIQPIGLRVLVSPDEAETTTAAGLIIPPSANDDKKPASGKIVKLGMIIDKDDKFVVKEGDRIFFKKYSPEEIEVEGVKYLIVEQDDVLAIIS